MSRANREPRFWLAITLLPAIGLAACGKDDGFNLERDLNPLQLAIASGATFLGFETDLQMGHLLDQVGLKPDRIEKTNMLKMWRAI